MFCLALRTKLARRDMLKRCADAYQIKRIKESPNAHLLQEVRDDAKLRNRLRWLTLRRCAPAVLRRRLRHGAFSGEQINSVCPDLR